MRRFRLVLSFFVVAIVAFLVGCASTAQPIQAEQEAAFGVYLLGKSGAWYIYEVNGIPCVYVYEGRGYGGGPSLECDFTKGDITKGLKK